ncbi:microtubule-associated protein Jupiter isoform X2 [Aphidius gifuensis]|uniref:microtubule-associated protein Jupiter isoform X2 n=1 Tax=Aphidius gifuensis TaxID=684658 RepID=UPI001CDBFBFC|nr:microtubule-associated protein Jupiter isoform X2 [Aphidius gifuensis]
MTSTGTFQGLNADRNSSKVLKPPGGGSSDIFGSSGQTSPRRIKNHNQSQLSSGFFGDSTNTGNTSPDSPRGNKPGNDSYKRLFGPPEPINPNTKNHMRSNISLSSSDYQDNLFTIKKMNGINGVLPSNGNSIINGNAFTNDNTAFRRNKRFRGSSCMPRNPVTGDGIIITPIKRNLRKCRDGNPVTGAGYIENGNNGGSQNGSSASSINGDNRSTTDSSPASVTSKPVRGRVPPGGFSSGLW